MTKNTNKGWFWQSVPDYVFTANMVKTLVSITAECCKKSDENISWISPEEKDQFISLGSGLFFDFGSNIRGHFVTPSIGAQVPIVGSHSIGGEVSTIFSGNKTQNNQFRSNGFGIAAFYQFDLFSFFGNGLTPFVRTSIPYQMLKNKNRPGSGPWIEAGERRNLGVNISPGIRFEQDHWGVNAEINFLTFTNTKFKPSNATQFGSANNIFSIGNNQPKFNLRFLWRI